MTNNQNDKIKKTKKEPETFKGITTKKLKNGTLNIMVRFKYLGKTYPLKNFTKEFGCSTESSANKKLDEVKVLISQNKDPFAKTYINLIEIFNERKEQQLKNKIWTLSTYRNYGYYFDKHIKPVIGKLKIENIKYEDIMKILNTFSKEQTGSKNTIIDILNPIFKEEYKKGNLQENQMLKVDKYTVHLQKKNISLRTPMKNIDIIRNLYNSIENYTGAKEHNLDDHKMFLYMLILTSHRFGEIIQLEKNHCFFEENKIIAPASITKTKEDYHYPIPEDCIEYIKNNENKILFNVPRGGTSSRVFSRLLKIANIQTNGNHTITMHDTRKLMMSIMINDLGIDSRLADYCLDHKPQGTIKHYLEFTYEDKVKAYHKYWEYIKTGKIENNSNDNNSNKIDNIIQLEKLIEMFEKDYLTKEEFLCQKSKLLS